MASDNLVYALCWHDRSSDDRKYCCDMDRVGTQTYEDGHKLFSRSVLVDENDDDINVTNCYLSPPSYSEPFDSRSDGVNTQHHAELYLYAQLALAFRTALL